VKGEKREIFYSSSRGIFSSPDELSKKGRRGVRNTNHTGGKKPNLTALKVFSDSGGRHDAQEIMQLRGGDL